MAEGHVCGGRMLTILVIEIKEGKNVQELKR